MIMNGEEINNDGEEEGTENASRNACKIRELFFFQAEHVFILLSLLKMRVKELRNVEN